MVHLINANSLDAASHFEAGSLDWIYIDTNHQYLNTQNELRAYKPLMKRTGYIAGHDYTIGNFRNGIRYGVVEAINSDRITHARGMLLGKVAPREDIPCTRCKLFQDLEKRGKFLSIEDIRNMPFAG